MTETVTLSEREQQILILVATGASNKEIAQQLAISANTVKVHLRNIFAKIGVMSRTEAAMYAVTNGLVPAGQGEERLPATDGFAPAGNGTGTSTADIEPVMGSQTTGTKAASQKQSYVTFALLLVLVVLVTAGVSRLLSRQQGVSPASASATLSAENRWRALSPLPTARFGMAVASYENNIYAIAGSSARGVSDVVEAFDTSKETWMPRKKKPTAAGDVQAVVIGGKIYVPGGRLADGSVTNVMEIYEPRSDEWQSGAAMPVAVSAYALATIEGKLYLFGGWDGKHYVSSVFAYNPATNKWNALTPMPTARGFAAAAVAGDKIYLIGGRDESGALSANEMFIPERAGSADAWVKVTAMPAGRYAMGAATIAGVIHVLGGESAGAEALTYLEYFPSTDSWRAYPNSLARPIAYPGLISQEAYLYMIGGEEDDAPSAQTWMYQAIYSVAVPLIR